ncbi:hypothetical protein PV08_10431 [Exophiala spinifera]|uniref:Grh/CP2 DB domain-containing protein n=1 Tax=Exophiala spinifera TaxID=91928 RepID=A0A0D1Y840_9EURO|nr:uncharacterized protein PV08_10431 [Exophiala spinifera]KIW11131.1 hypothetical protein PV08_10431 [Exophiala spinifera]
MSPTLLSSDHEEDVTTDTDYFSRGFDTQPEAKEQDATPKPFADNWRFTPSIMDPNSFAFSAFANQPPGYYTPTPGGFGTLYHPQAGDLHTPGMGMNTPLSMPHSIHSLHAQDPMMHLQHFNPHLLHQPHVFHDPFHQQAPVHVPPPQQPQAFAPQQFLQHQDSGYVAMDDTPQKTTPTQLEMGGQRQLSRGRSIQQSMPGMVGMTSLPMGEQFRFHTTLNAPTAMVRHADEIPITYLNKGQAYTMSIWDQTPPMTQLPGNTPFQYRTYVRVSFEDEQQRARPGSCWQLWKEGRGSNEAHQRGGRLLAVEYVEPELGDDELRKAQVQLEKASFDGFAVTWFPDSVNGGPDCNISLRFNFLSTDFSHSKGVKGIPVRLCAKTELLSPTGTGNEPEVCFSKVKLFRDHGAERKLSNDVAHVKKTIEKLKQQIAQAEAGLVNSGKRRRSGSVAKPSGSRPGKVVKHKRTWSVDSESEGLKFSAEEDLQMKLVSMQDMFSSTRPISVLFLRGDAEDDPDLHPVKLPGDDPDMKEIVRTTTWESRPSVSDSPTSNAGSPSTSSASQATPKKKFSQLQHSAIQEEGESEAENRPTTSTSRLIKIPKTEPDSASKKDLFAVDVDSSYHPPIEKPIRPVACFYVRQKDAAKEYYRAVYLMERTVKALIHGIAEKFNIDAYRVTQVTHINSRGLHIIVDEDVVRELAEGQDMVVEFTPGQPDSSQKQEFVARSSTEVMVDGDIGPTDTSILDPLEMWLNY